jgi:hypothetical protein
MTRRIRGRAIVVLEERPFLWAALRQRVEPAVAYVLSATPDEIRAVWDDCDPWPWVLAGTTRELPDGLGQLLAGAPVAVHWLGQPPAALPPGSAVHDDWLALAEDLAVLGDRAVNGVRLLRNRGLRTADGRTVLDVAHVEGLMGAPAGLAAVDEHAVAAELTRGRLPLRLAWQGDRVRLVPAPTGG